VACDSKRRLRNCLAEQVRRLVRRKPPKNQEAERLIVQPSLNLLVTVSTARLKDKDPAKRIEAAESLGNCATKPVPDELIAALEDRHPEVRRAAADALARLRDERALPPLVELLDDRYETVRAAAAHALGEIKDARAVEALARRMAQEPDRRVHVAIVHALGAIGTPETVEPLCAALEGPIYEARVEAAQALGKHNDPEVVDALIAALPDADYGVIVNERWAQACWPRLRVWAMRALAEIGDQRAVEPITAYLESDDLSSRLPAALALLHLSGKSTKDVPWPEVVRMLSDHIEEATGRELLGFVPREYLRR